MGARAADPTRSITTGIGFVDACPARRDLSALRLSRGTHPRSHERPVVRRDRRVVCAAVLQRGLWAGLARPEAAPRRSPLGLQPLLHPFGRRVGVRAVQWSGTASSAPAGEGVAGRARAGSRAPGHRGALLGRTHAGKGARSGLRRRGPPRDHAAARLDGRGPGGRTASRRPKHAGAGSRSTSARWRSSDSPTGPTTPS